MAQFITVVGGGNSTPIFAALAKHAGYRVAILTRRPADWTADVGFVNEGAQLVSRKGGGPELTRIKNI